MICKFSVENYKAFRDRVELDFCANMNIKRFNYNIFDNASINVLKAVGIYGPNNTGKTCILLALMSLKALMLNEQHDNLKNVFANQGDVTKFSVEYLIQDRYYIYSVQYNNKTRLYEQESLFKRDKLDGSVAKVKIFERNQMSLSWYGLSADYKKIDLSRLFSLSFPVMMVLNIDDEIINQAKKDYIDFANSILFLKMDGPVDISKTIELMQSDKKATNFIKQFVKNCDLHIEDFGFDDNVTSDTNIENELRVAMSNPAFIKETLKIYSRHNGYKVPSVFFDSIGTQKLIALSGYIYDAVYNGKILVIDEIDSSLHHLITKAIVAMFNNMLNTKAQLIFTTHDVQLLDLKEMFRKDQIWLVDVLDRSSSKIIRMSDEFTARSEDGIRGDEDIVEYYLKGQFGSIPTPDLFSALEEITTDE